MTADGVTTSTLTATLLDAQGNPIAGKTVTLAKSGGSSSIATVNGVTDASGAARFTVTDAVAETTTYTATDTTDSLTVDADRLRHVHLRRRQRRAVDRRCCARLGDS